VRRRREREKERERERLTAGEAKRLRDLVGVVCGGCAGGGVAVRLHSVEAEITTLTCLDYWLDAAMSGVAATAVCFYRAGRELNLNSV
jgi:hypothetical protein